MEIDISKGATVNLTYKNNSDFDLSVNVTQSGAAYDMSGKTVRMMIKKNRNFQSYVYRLVSGTDITISTSNLTWSKTMDLPNDTYYYDVYNVTDSDYIMGGLLKVKRNITT
jgi:hypothetical protein